MSDITSGDVSETRGSDAGGTASTAAHEARDVASTAGHEAGRVAATAKDEAGAVAHEVAGQARELYHQTQGELREQAARQQERVASGLQALASQLGSMADGADQQGVATDLVRQVSARAGDVGHWLGDRDPGTLLSDVKSFARRKPGVFIGVAALAGLAAGRLTRALAQGAPTAGDTATGRAGASPAATGAASAPVQDHATPVQERAGYVPPAIPPVGGGQVAPAGVAPVYDRTQAERDGAPFIPGGDDDRRDAF